METNQKQKPAALSPAEQAFKDLKEKKERLLGLISNTDNLVDSFRFIADALAYSLTNDDYSGQQERNDLQFRYHAINGILTQCEIYAEAEAVAKHYTDRETPNTLKP